MFCTFLPRQFALRSPDSTLNEAQAINFLFYALVTCDSWQIGYIDNRMKTPSPTPDAILQTAFGFWNSKVLLSAVTFDLFSTLGQRRLTGADIGNKLDLHPRGVADFLDALVAMKFLEREGDGANAKYFNTPATALYLDRSSPRYIGGIPEMLNARLFKYWNDLPEALRTGKAQNETKHGGKNIFDELYADPEKLECFLDGMTSLSRINFEVAYK